MVVVDLEQNQHCLTWQLIQARPLKFLQAMQRLLQLWLGNSLLLDVGTLLGIGKPLSLAKKIHHNVNVRIIQICQKIFVRVDLS